jgi:phenylacetaldehyde dehydrogenase
VFVPPQLRDELVAALVTELGRLRAGDPFDDDTTFGPQAFTAQADSLHARLDEFSRAGATVVAALPVLAGDRWVAPTLVIDPPAELARAEVFGPVLVVRTCADAAAAVAESFELETGLAGYVFTSDVAEGMRVGALLPAGEVKLNGSSLLDMSDRSAQAFWYGSGVGGHGDADLLRFFTGARIVGQDVDSPL